MVDSAMVHSSAPDFVVRNQHLAPWLRLFALAGLAILSSCGGNHSSPAVAPPPEVTPPGVAPPTALSYVTPRALYVKDEVITANPANVSGGPVASFTVSPALPSGLSLDVLTGLITGTPTTLQRETNHTVTASNAAGSVQAPLRLTITGRGAWTSVPTVPTPRLYATLSRLPDGRQLLAGGMTGAGPSLEADIYDPATNTWSAADDMVAARSNPSAVVLADGRVLVFGGDAAGFTTLASAEIYDPVANTWTATGSMNEPRTGSTAHVLPDGRVLVVGGLDQTGATTFSSTVERYDPATGTWTVLPTPLSAARAQHAAQLLPDGVTLLVVGGVGGSGHVTSAERYAVDGSATTPIAYGASGNVYLSVRLDDGSVLVVSEDTTARRFDPATSSWTTSGMSATRLLPTMTLLADGRVLLAGGSNLDSAEIYNPDLNVWTTATSMGARRNRSAAALLDDGRVLVVSGYANPPGAEVNSTETFTP